MSATVVCSCPGAGCGVPVATLRKHRTGWRLEFPGSRRQQATDEDVAYVRQPDEYVDVPGDIVAKAEVHGAESWVLRTRCPKCGSEVVILPYGSDFVSAFNRAVETKSIRGVSAIPMQ